MDELKLAKELNALYNINRGLYFGEWENLDERQQARWLSDARAIIEALYEGDSSD